MRIVLVDFDALRFAGGVLLLVGILAGLIAMPTILYGGVTEYLASSRFGWSWLFVMTFGGPLIAAQIGAYLWDGLRFGGAALVLKDGHIMAAGQFLRLSLSEVRSISVGEHSLRIELRSGRVRNVLTLGWAESGNVVRGRILDLVDPTPNSDSPLNFR